MHSAEMRRLAKLSSDDDFRPGVSPAIASSRNRNSEFDARSLIRQGAKQAECFEVVAETTSKSLL